MKDSNTIIIRINELETGGATRAYRGPGEVIEEAKETFEQRLSKIQPTTKRVIMVCVD